MTRSTNNPKEMQVLALNYEERKAFLSDDEGRTFYGRIDASLDSCGDETDNLDEAVVLILQVTVDGKDLWVVYKVNETDEGVSLN